VKEIKDIISAYKEATRNSKEAAIATVVHVEGSSYRRAGARMLVTDDGQLTGAISGGCLEGDALRKALLAITEGKNKLVTYDTTDEDDAKFGVQLGCNGIVHILFEPIKGEKEYNAIYLLEQLIARRKNAVLVTCFSLSHSVQPGTSLLYRGDFTRTSLSNELNELVLADARTSFDNETSLVKKYSVEGGEFDAFIEFIPPSVAVVIAGAGNDVQPLTELTAILGWQTTVVDGRSTHALQHRFPRASKVIVLKPDEVLREIKIDAHTVFILMTHNYIYDLALLKELLEEDCTYIGILGPKKKMDRMFSDLSEAGIVLNEQQQKSIYSPVGLDIGAETAEEIAVSIVAEIKAVFEKTQGSFLRDKALPIHGRPKEITGPNE
jgi:xanthine/CO dehydrogenase XdhC/CoxF family maturation factor